MLASLFDEYSLNARVRPALLALLPLIVAIYVAFPQLYEAAAAIISILLVCGLLTVLAHYCRHKGSVVENQLFSSWGGKPTTVLLRHRDSTIDALTKRRYHDYFAKQIAGWTAPTVEEEVEDPQSADESYDSAVKWLLERTRDTKRYGLLYKENINYGFRRNSYGIRWHARLLALAAIAVLYGHVWISGEFLPRTLDVVETAAAILALVLLAWWIFIVRIKWVRDAAEGYALRLLSACDTDERT